MGDGCPHCGPRGFLSRDWAGDVSCLQCGFTPPEPLPPPPPPPESQAQERVQQPREVTPRRNTQAGSAFERRFGLGEE